MRMSWSFGLPAAGLAVVLALAGCAGSPSAPGPDAERQSDSTPSTAQQSPLVGERWQLILLGTSERWSSDQPAYIEIEHAGGELRLSGSNGCNRLMGQVQLDDGNRIQVGELASTRMACPNMADAQRVEELLNNAYRYLIDHDRLVLFGSDSRVLGGFQRR